MEEKRTKIIVTEEDFTVAETDFYMSRHIKDHPVNTIRHARETSSKDNQFVIRENQDVLYSHMVSSVDGHMARQAEKTL